MAELQRTNGRADHVSPLIRGDRLAQRSRGITRADVMSASDVAVLIGAPKSTIEDWARRGVIPSRKKGRRRLFLRWEVEAWLVADD